MVTALGNHLILMMTHLGEFLILMSATMKGLIRPPFRLRQVIQQIYFVANKSVVIVAFCVSFAAMVTIVEASFHMKLVVKNDAMVPGFAALLILRELGSVLAALLLTSRVGAGYAAEVGSMKVTEQIDALKMLSINPIQYLVVPRFIACVIGGLLLSVVSNLVCLLSAAVVSATQLGISSGDFMVAMSRFVQFQDLTFAIIKGGVFGAVIPLVSCYYGFRCVSGAEGVGRATTQSVVTSSVAIIILDFLLSYTFSHFY